nr:DUF3159 domain-containing protein [Ornithinimicrobium sp. INDO-MA30-4]
MRSGDAEDAFLPGILISAAYGAGALVSILARWPLIGFLVAAADPTLPSSRPHGAATVGWCGYVAA